MRVYRGSLKVSFVPKENIPSLCYVKCKSQVVHKKYILSVKMPLLIISTKNIINKMCLWSKLWR